LPLPEDTKYTVSFRELVSTNEWNLVKKTYRYSWKKADEIG
jgi:hypothetical protein